MKYSLRNNGVENGSEIYIDKTGEIVAVNQNYNWQVKSNPNISMKLALHTFTTLFRSHELRWNLNGEKLLDFLNSDGVAEVPKYKESPIDKNDILTYSQGTETLRTSISNHMIASKEDGVWDFNTSAAQKFELLSQKTFLTAYKNDFKMSPEDIVKSVNHAMDKEIEKTITGMNI